MKKPTSKIKNITLMSVGPIDIHNDCLDVYVTLEDDDFEYSLEVGTPEFFSSYMTKRNQNFFEPSYPFIIVRELRIEVIREAIEAFINENEDGYWFKFYHSVGCLTIDDLNSTINRYKKEQQLLENQYELDKLAELDQDSCTREQSNLLGNFTQLSYKFLDSRRLENIKKC